VSAPTNARIVLTDGMPVNYVLNLLKRSLTIPARRAHRRHHAAGKDRTQK
jgi:hypothetical protein